MPETLSGSLLKYKAMAWRSLSVDGSSGEKGIRWKAEIEDESFGVALQRNLKRPFIMLVKEPILAFFSIYLTGESSLPLSFHNTVEPPRLAARYRSPLADS